MAHDHHHGDRNAFYMEQLLTIGVCGAFAGVTLVLWSSGALKYLLADKFHLWVFLGGPHIEQLRGNKKIAMTLSAVTAAVVGVILNLAVWFALHVVHPQTGFDWFAIALGLAALVAMIRWNVGVIPVIIAGSLIGFVSVLIHFR